MKIKRKAISLLLAGVCLLAGQLTLVKAAGPSGPVFFPKGVFSTDAEADRLSAAHYTKYLQALQEPSLYGLKNNPKNTSFRFLYLRLFEPPVVIRIETLANGSGKIYFKATSGTGAYKPGNLATNKTEKLSKQQMQKCVSKITNSDFWSLPVQAANLDGCDGAQWLLEGVREGRYHLVERQSPRRGTVRRLGLYFLKLSGEKIRDFD